MTSKAYKRQVGLLLSVIPEIAKEKCFTLHGGTAINLFVRDMPRLSVDLDLTYSLTEDRATTFANISESLGRIKTNIEKNVSDARAEHRDAIGKLLVAAKGVNIKVEVSLVSRGLLDSPVKMTLCKKAQKEFEAFCAIDIVPMGQLYGGKICAALDRQHPRDLFDVKYLLNNEGFTNEIKEGFLFRLLSGERPINEVLFPNLLDQRPAMENQFSGMSEEDFSYEEYENVRERMVSTVHESLTAQDKQFILSVKNLTPDWSIYQFEKFPAIAWKLQNLQKLKEKNPGKHTEQYKSLEQKLNNI